MTLEGPGVFGSLSPCIYQPPLGLLDPRFESGFESLGLNEAIIHGA